MKIEELTSYKLNHQALQMMATVKENYPAMKTVLMNLKTISNELNGQTIKEITGENGND